MKLTGGIDMTPRQKRFVEEYLIDLNATQAAIRAGYSPNRADATANKLLSFTEVQDTVAAAMAERSKRTEVTADQVVKELAVLAFTDFRKAVSWGPDGVRLLPSDELSADEAAIIAEVSETRSENGGSIKAKRYDKLKALELLGRHLGMFKDRVEIEKPLEPPNFIINFVKAGEETPQDVIDGVA
jgi:phage terminase small subunit